MLSHAASRKAPFLTLRLFDVTIFLVSANALALEIVAGRALAPYIGMSLYSWTAVIAVVLAGLSVGHWIGGHLASPARQPQQKMLFIGVTSALAALTALISLPLLAWLTDPVLIMAAHPALATLALSAPAFFLPSLFAGVIAPLVTQLALQLDPKHTGRVLGRIYALGAIGSIAGTLSSGYWFIAYLGSAKTVLVIAGGFFLIACVYLLSYRRKPTVVTILLAIPTIVWTISEKTSVFLSPCYRESPYHCLRVLDVSEQLGRRGRLLILDHIGHGVNDQRDPGRLYWTHLHFIDEFARLHYPDGEFKALILGGGSYTLPRAWAHAEFGERIDILELDPAVTRAASEQLWVDTASLNIDHRDARVALRTYPHSAQYDLIIGDAIRDLTVPYHLITDEFNAEIKKRLKDNGHYIINVVDDQRSPRFVPSLIRTLERRFPGVEVWVETADTLKKPYATFVLIAGTSSSERSVIKARHGLARGWTRVDTANKKFRSGATMLSDHFAPVERLMEKNLLRTR